jgi:phosphoribosylanthranilate isomerase
MKRPIKVKVCGLRHPGNIEEVCALSPDFVGFIFHPGSQRFVGEKPDPAIFRIPGEGTARVGIFVNEEVSRVRSVFESYWLDLVQLHGEEDPEYCRNLTDAGIPVIKVLFPADMGSGKDFRAGEREIIHYREAAHYLLFDSGRSGSGGSGLQFDWNLVGEGFSCPLPFLLGGGVGPDDTETLKGLMHPSFFGVDVNSRFETSPGVKDARLLAQFIDAIRN